MALLDRAGAPALVHPALHRHPSSSSTPLLHTFAFADFLQREYRFGLDGSRPYCKAFREGHCPLGNACPDKHQITHSFNNLVCKHWLRGLCKKGDQCEFLHEYNLRRMPECTHYAKDQFCPNGDDCLYLHIDPAAKLAPCPQYDKGFCSLGDRCSRKHVRKTICTLYLAGFCPAGKQCRAGAHPRWPENLAPAIAKAYKTAEEIELEKVRMREEGEKAEERDWERRDGNRREGQGRGGGGGRGKGRFGGKRRGGGGYDR